MDVDLMGVQTNISHGTITGLHIALLHTQTMEMDVVLEDVDIERTKEVGPVPMLTVVMSNPPVMHMVYSCKNCSRKE